MTSHLSQYKNVCLVGNKWQKHLGALPTFSISQLMHVSFAHFPSNTTFQVGQGVCPQELNALTKKLKNQAFNIPNITLCPTHYVHKKNKSNIMITDPTELEYNQYSAQLCINENCSELQDHFTGQHINAMVLIEAARQMITAVTEKFLLNTSPTSLRFVLNTLESHFHTFVFPAPASIIFVLKEKKILFQHNARLHAEIKIIQNNQCCSSFKMHYTLLQANFFDYHEKTLCENVFYETLK